MKRLLPITFLILAMGCRETEDPPAVEIQIDEEALGQVLVESFVKGASAFADTPDEVIDDSGGIGETVKIMSRDGSQVILEIDQTKLTSAIHQGMITATTPIIDLPISAPPSPPQKKEAETSHKISVKALANGNLYGIVDGEESLIATAFTGEDTEALEAWLEKSTQDRSRKWVLTIQAENEAPFGMTRAISRAAAKKDLKSVAFRSVK